MLLVGSSNREEARISVNYHNDAEEGPAKQHNKKKHRFLKVFSALLAFVLVISIISSVSVASVFTIVKVFLVSVLSLLIVLIFIVIVSPVPVALIVRDRKSTRLNSSH